MGIDEMKICRYKGPLTKKGFIIIILCLKRAYMSTVLVLNVDHKGLLVTVLRIEFIF